MKLLVLFITTLFMMNLYATVPGEQQYVKAGGGCDTEAFKAAASGFCDSNSDHPCCCNTSYDGAGHGAGDTEPETTTGGKPAGST